ADVVLALEEGRQRQGAGADRHPGDVAVGMTGDDHTRQLQELLRGGQAVPRQGLAVVGVDLHERHGIAFPGGGLIPNRLELYRFSAAAQSWATTPWMVSGCSMKRLHRSANRSSTRSRLLNASLATTSRSNGQADSTGCNSGVFAGRGNNSTCP